MEERAEYLVETYADTILRLCRSYLREPSDAQDVCQTVFLKLLTEPRSFESPQHEKAYILKMAANACRDLLRSPWRRRGCPLEACAELPAPEREESGVWEAVGRLPPHYRAVIYLYYYEGYQAAEIGEILSIRVSTVKSHVSSVLSKLDVKRRAEAKTAAKKLRLIPDDL